MDTAQSIERIRNRVTESHQRQIGKWIQSQENAAVFLELPIGQEILEKQSEDMLAMWEEFIDIDLFADDAIQKIQKLQMRARLPQELIMQLVTILIQGDEAERELHQAVEQSDEYAGDVVAM